MSANDRSGGKQGYTTCDKIQRSSLGFDLYSRPISLLIPGGEDAYGTSFGSLLSLFTVIAVMSYTIYQIMLIADPSDYVYKLEVEEDVFT